VLFLRLDISDLIFFLLKEAWAALLQEGALVLLIVVLLQTVVIQRIRFLSLPAHSALILAQIEAPYKESDDSVDN